MFFTWCFLAWAGLYLALMYGFDVHEEQRRSAELRERAHIAQLRALHSQINPHFLFNSLNSVSALILDKNTEKAEEMVVKLAHFLRLGLAADPTRKIPLDLEIELQRSYLEIEQLRFPDLSFESRCRKRSGSAGPVAHPSADHRECGQIWRRRSAAERHDIHSGSYR